MVIVKYSARENANFENAILRNIRTGQRSFDKLRTLLRMGGRRDGKEGDAMSGVPGATEG
jgi:hypothetical protein